MTRNEIMAPAEKVGLTSLSLIDVAYLERFSALVSASERDRIEFDGMSLYEKTGDIKDINTIMIQRSAIRAMGAAMTKPSNHCDECKHFTRYETTGTVCKFGHRPMFRKPKNDDQHRMSWGWKRRCDDFNESTHEPAASNP